MVFYLVANALIYRRHVITSCRPPLHTILFLFLLSSASLGFSVSWKLEKWWGSALFSSLAAITTASFHRMVPFHGGGDLQWSVPLMPWPASASIFLNIFLMTRLKAISGDVGSILPRVLLRRMRLRRLQDGGVGN